MLQPRLITLLLCESVGRGPNGRKTLYGLIDHFQLTVFPAVIPGCAIFGRFGSGDGTFTARFAIRGPSGQMVFEPRQGCEFSLDDPLDVADVVLSIDNLTLPEPGTYWIETWLGDARLPQSAALFVDRVKV